MGRKNTEHISSVANPSKYRIPDEMVLHRIDGTITGGWINEIKNVKYLSYTAQLKDYMMICEKYNLAFGLTVRKNTVLSAPLLEMPESVNFC